MGYARKLYHSGEWIETLSRVRSFCYFSRKGRHLWYQEDIFFVETIMALP